MINPFTLIGVVILIGLVPIFFGIFLRSINNNTEIKKSVLNNFSLGIVFALFVDFIVNSSQLGINLGINTYSMTLLLSFIFGFVLIFFLSSMNFKFSYMNILLVSLGLSFHSFAEGIIIGYDINNLGIFLSIPRSVQTMSFVIHKLAEGFIIPIFYTISFSSIILFTLISASPIVFGSILGIYGIPGIISSVFFAISSGALLFIIIDLVKTDQLISNNKISDIFFILLGFVLIYMAGLLHSL